MQAEHPSTKLESWGEPFVWKGFEGREGLIEGVLCKVIRPHQSLAARPWAWRPEFFDAFAEVDEQLLHRGLHLVYHHLPDQYGSPDAISYGNALHFFVAQVFELAFKVSFIALSRAGLFAFNWAAENPEKVACIYADNPVCDFKSWPAGWGRGKGCPTDWEKCMGCYGLTEEGARAYIGNPVDHAEALARAGIPLFLVLGDCDKVVPVPENAAEMKRRFVASGGTYREIIKEGCGHHPHGLPDPTPIVDFIVGYSSAPQRA